MHDYNSKFTILKGPVSKVEDNTMCSFFAACLQAGDALKIIVLPAVYIAAYITRTAVYMCACIQSAWPILESSAMCDLCGLSLLSR